jgi:acyl-CoA thioester hydrolase
MDYTESSNIDSNLNERWFDYPIKVFPHHTDYGGVVWHGTYMTWLEEARIECLASVGASFADFVSIGCNVIVVNVELAYKQPLRMGVEAIVRTRVTTEGIKLVWEYKIQSPDSEVTYLTGVIKLVPIDIQKERVMRKLPPTVQEALNKLLSTT